MRSHATSSLSRASRDVAFAIGLASSVASALHAPLARAAEDAASDDAASDDVLAAHDAFQSARQLSADGRHAEACEQFAQSERLYSTAVTLLNLGNCFEKGTLSGGLLEAVRAFERALVEADAIPEPEVREQVRQEVQRRLDGTRASVPLLVLRRSSTPEARVLLDGSVVDQFGVALPLNPGEHQLELSAPGKLSEARRFMLAERRELEFALPELADTPGPAAPPPAVGRPSVESPFVESPSVESRARRFGDLPFWLGGASVVLGAAWLYTGLTSNSSDDEYGGIYERCRAGGCDDGMLARMATAQDKARDYARVTDYVIVPAFGATLGTALVLWWMDGFALSDVSTRADAKATPVTWQAGCAHDGCRGTLTGSF